MTAYHAPYTAASHGTFPAQQGQEIVEPVQVETTPTRHVRIATCAVKISLQLSRNDFTPSRSKMNARGFVRNRLLARAVSYMDFADCFRPTNKTYSDYRHMQDCYRCMLCPPIISPHLYGFSLWKGIHWLVAPRVR